MSKTDSQLVQDLIEAFPHLSPSELAQEVYEHRVE